MCTGIGLTYFQGPIKVNERRQLIFIGNPPMQNINQNNPSIEIGDDEDVYDFGSVKYPTSSRSSIADDGRQRSREPSRSGSVKSSRSYREQHLDGRKMNQFFLFYLMNK